MSKNIVQTNFKKKKTCERVKIVGKIKNEKMSKNVKNVEK